MYGSESAKRWTRAGVAFSACVCGMAGEAAAQASQPPLTDTGLLPVFFVVSGMAILGGWFAAYLLAHRAIERRTASIRKKLLHQEQAAEEMREHYEVLVGTLGKGGRAPAASSEEASLAPGAVQRLQKLNQLKEALLASGGFEDKLKNITDTISSLFEVDFCRIWLVRPGDLCDKGCIHALYDEGPHACKNREHCLHLMASSGKHARLDSRMHHRVPFGCYKIGRVGAGEERKFLTNDVANDRRVPNPKWAAKLGLVAFAGYKLVAANGDPMGVLAFFANRAISPEEDAMIEGMANSISAAIQKAQADVERERIIKELRDALTQIKTLKGLLPICARCKKVRDDSGYWNQIEVYVTQHSDAEFSHSVCPECMKKLYPDFYRKQSE